MAGEKFKLNFITNGKGITPIDEPEGFDSVPFTFKQDSKRYGRDKFFGGDEENEFTFNLMRNHQLETLLYDFETTGWETESKLIIEKDGIDNIVGDLDYQYAVTDQLQYFKCKVIQDSNQALLKRRSELIVDVFSDEDIDGNAIEGLETDNVLVKSKPIIQKSSWETPTVFNEELNATSGIVFVRNTEYYRFNPSVNLTSYNIDNSLTFFENLQNTSGGDDFKIIEAQNNLRKTNVTISNLDLLFATSSGNGGNGYMDCDFVLRYGKDFNSSLRHVFFTKNMSDSDADYTNNNSYEFEIPYINRGDSIWLMFEVKVRQSASSASVNAFMRLEVTINSMNVDLTTSSIAYNTIVPSIRLKDGVSQVVKSISGLTTSFPFAEPNGEMYNQRLFSGNLLRNLTGRAFNISFDDIEKWLPEINGDYQVQNDGSVFFDKYDGFYQNKEIGVFTSVRFDSYKKYLNERYATNQFSYKYKKYQSQKESEVENTFDISHGESQWSILNRFVENKKEVIVPFVRCSFYLDEQRRKGFDLNNNTSTQDDDTIFILDTKEALNDSEFTETDFLQHTFDNENKQLKLSNTGNFSFILLGLAVGETFQIIDDANAGLYTIIEVTERYIILNSLLGTVNNNGERITQFKYIVSITTSPFISWSNEGFAYIDGILDSENFANLKYTVKRNIVRFYNQYLATCNLFSKKPIKNTLYKNKGNLSMSYGGVQTIENQEFTPTNPILSPYKHEVTIITDFNSFMDLQNKAKTERGYFRTFDANGHVIKLYPQEMTFNNTDEEGELYIIGEEKLEPSLINITYAALGYISINNEYRVQRITYAIDEEKVSIMDEFGLLMYNPVFWQKVTVNNATSETKDDLIDKLNLLI